MITQSRNRTIRDTMSQLSKTLATMQKQAEEQAKLIKQTALVISRVRGTRDITDKAREAVARMAPAEPLADRVRTAIESDGPASAAELAERLGEPLPVVQREVSALRRSGRLTNVGDTEAPRWWWSVGEHGSTPELKRSLAILLSYEPMTLTQLAIATRCTNRNRISGALVKLQAMGIKFRNLGDRQRFVWSVEKLTASARHALDKLVADSTA